MNRSDIKLILILFIISLIFYVLLRQSNNGEYANVYYENNIIKKIDLKKDDIYIVEGYNGEIKIEVKNNKIRVVEETSFYNICSKKGFVSSSLDPIICLPNKVVIKIESSNELDAIVR